MKTEYSKTILDTTFDNHTLHIDKIVEVDPDGNPMVSKLIAHVLKPNGVAELFCASPYTPLGELVDMAKCWISCGCPSNVDEYGIPVKWTKESLHRWVAS